MIELIIPVAAFVLVLQFFSIIYHKKSLPEFRFPNQIGGRGFNRGICLYNTETKGTLSIKYYDLDNDFNNLCFIIVISLSTARSVICFTASIADDAYSELI